MDSKYIRDGMVARDVIALDILSRRLTGGEIERVADDPVVQDAFFGVLEPIKRTRREWTPRYLDRLCGAVAAECFNREYLLYLDHVADYVSKAKFRRIVLAGVIIILVFIAGVLAYVYTLGPADMSDGETNPGDGVGFAEGLSPADGAAQMEARYV